MRRLIPCIALGLLATCGVEPSLTKPVLNGVELPDIGSTEARAAEAEFRAWFAQLPGTQPPNLHQEHQLELQVALRGSRGQDFQADLEAEILTDIADMAQMRFDWKGVFSGSGAGLDNLFGGMPLEFGATILFTEDLLWAHSETYNSLLVAPPGKAVQASVEGLEDVYQKIIEFTKRDAVAHASEFPGMAAYTEGLLKIWPESISGVVHPTSMLHAYLPVLTCRHLERVDGVVDAYLSLDMQEGSLLEPLLLEMDDLLIDAELEAGMAESIQEMVSYLPELMVVHLRLDEKYGNILLVEITLRLDPEEFGGSRADGVLTFDYHLEGNGWQVPSMPDTLFWIDERIETFDATPFLPLLLVALEAEVSAVEKDEDYDF